MFPKTKNIESSFRSLRLLSLVSIIGSLCSGVFFFVWSTNAIQKAQSTVHILSAGKAFEAFASDRKSNLRVEARWHVINFHDYFFTLDPDEKVITDNLTKALYLVDGSGKRIYENLKESGYYANVISANISQRVTVDSIALNMAVYPFYFRLYGVETITRPSSTVTRELQTEGWLREVSRSDNNAHGFLIERWAILSNRDLKIESR